MSGTNSKAGQARRINGAKSRGPVTPEGKARSAQNARKHGAYANHAVLLDNESRRAFHIQLAAYNQRFAPSDPYECNLVRELCTIDWLLVRSRASEANLLNTEMIRQAPELAEIDPDFPEPFKLAHALRGLTDNSRALGHTLRQVGQLSRARRETLDALIRVRNILPIPKRTGDLSTLQQLNSADEPISEPVTPGFEPEIIENNLETITPEEAK